MTRTMKGRLGRLGRWMATVWVVLATAGVPASVTAQDPPADPVGSWALALEGPFAAQAWTLQVSREGGAWAAVLDMGMGTAPLQDLTWTDDTLTGGFTADMHGQRVTVTVTTTFAGDHCEGRATGFPMGTMTYTGKREGSTS